MASRSNILYAYPPTSSVHTQGNNLGPLITKAKTFDTMRDDLLFAAQSQTEVQTWEELHEIYPRHMVIDRVVPLKARCVRVCVHAHVRMRGPVFCMSRIAGLAQFAADSVGTGEWVREWVCRACSQKYVHDGV